MIDEGYIKYQIDWTETPPIDRDLSELIKYRNLLWDQQLIGYYQDHGVGYGNISILSDQGPEFVISGTQTGHIPQLDQSHFALATTWDLEQNTLACSGPIKASSEALTHAAVYACSPKIKAVIHIHSRKLWDYMLPRRHGL